MSIQTILVVEPSPVERAQIAQTLSTAGYQVVVAADGEEGVAIARREYPDLILMEVVMPGQNGYQATRALTRSEDERLARTPIILIRARGRIPTRSGDYVRARSIIWSNRSVMTNC